MCEQRDLLSVRCEIQLRRVVNDQCSPGHHQTPTTTQHLRPATGRELVKVHHQPRVVTRLLADKLSPAADKSATLRSRPPPMLRVPELVILLKKSM